MITKEDYDLQFKRALAFFRRFGVYIEKGNDGIVSVTQKEIKGGNLMNQKQLYDRAKMMYPQARIHPHVYRLDIEVVTPDWITERSSRYGIKRKDLIKNLGIDGSTLSLYLKGKRPMTKAVKALFYYYFLVFETNEKHNNLDYPQDTGGWLSYEEYTAKVEAGEEMAPIEIRP